MFSTWILVLVTLMVHSKRTREPSDESNSETESEEWNEALTENVPKASATAKGKSSAKSKAKTPPTAAEKGKSSSLRPRKAQARKNTINTGIQIDDSPEERVVSSERIKEFVNKECIGERHVDLRALRDRSQEFGILVDNAGLAPICSFPETTGFCIDLIRQFYQNGTGLIDDEDGVKQFVTIVANKRIIITPDLIGKVVGMVAVTEGAHYIKGHNYNNTTWRTVVDAICRPDTQSAGNSVYSRELRLEYKLLNYIVCYNILPNMSTKLLRWDRMLFLYLIGNPAASMGTNYNIPFLIWSRMTKYLDTTRSSERLPYPMIIMRIFRLLHVNTEATSYMHSLGTINDTTFVKSIPNQPDELTPPRMRRPATAASAAATTSTSASASEGASQSSVCNELAGISERLENLEKKHSTLMKMVQKLLQHFNCGSPEGSN